MHDDSHILHTHTHKTAECPDGAGAGLLKIVTEIGIEGEVALVPILRDDTILIDTLVTDEADHAATVPPQSTLRRKTERRASDQTSPHPPDPTKKSLLSQVRKRRRRVAVVTRR